MTKVPDDPNMTPEVRRFLDDRYRRETTITTRIDTVEATIPALATQSEAETGTNNTTYTSPLRVAQEITALSPFGSAFIFVRDEKTSGTDGGDFNQGSWVTRTLNTTVTNRITGASLASNKITLPSGRYFVQASAPAYSCVSHQARLYDVTAGAPIIIGTSERSVGGLSPATNRSFVDGEFTLSVQSDVRLEHQCSSTKSTNGLGQSGSFGTEVYAQVIIWKVA